MQVTILVPFRFNSNVNVSIPKVQFQHVCHHVSSTVKSRHLSSCRGDKYIEVNGKICVVRNILLSPCGDVFLVYAVFNKWNDLYTYPLPSSTIGVYRVSELSDAVHYVPLTVYSTLRKYVLLPVHADFGAFIFLHTQ